MKLSYIVLVSLFSCGQGGDRTCFCSGPGSGRGCNFSALYCSPLDNNCNKENVALGKPVTYNSLKDADKYSQDAVTIQGCMAANGYTETEYIASFDNPLIANCYHSALHDSNQNFEINLGRKYTLTDITIFARSGYLYRMKDTIVSVDGTTCYVFPRSDPMIRTDILCDPPLRGSRVRLHRNVITNDGVYMIVCEVQVWVCKAGLYGTNCEHACSNHCKGCDNYDGSCQEGCTDGFYGSLCEFNCRYCDAKYCNTTVEYCIPPKCNAGWHGETCSQACRNGTYSQNCQKACGNCKKATVCHAESGLCPEGCESGWMSDNCNTSCPTSRYGPNCSQACNNCERNMCNKITGQCISGCKAGLMSEDCTVACPKGTYGKNCTMKCGQCKDDQCNTANGVCQAGCVDDYKGIYCQETYMITPLQTVSIVVGVTLPSIALVAFILILIIWRRKYYAVKEMPSEHLLDPLDPMRNAVSLKAHDFIRRPLEVIMEENEDMSSSSVFPKQHSVPATWQCIPNESAETWGSTFSDVDLSYEKQAVETTWQPVQDESAETWGSTFSDVDLSYEQPAEETYGEYGQPAEETYGEYGQPAEETYGEYGQPAEETYEQSAVEAAESKGEESNSSRGIVPSHK